MKTQIGSAACLLISAVGVATAGPLVLVSNLDVPQRSFNTLDINLFAAQSFFTGEFAYDLVSIEAIVGNDKGLFTPIAELRAADDDGNMDTTPAGLITMMGVPDLVGPLAARPFIPDIPVTLEAGTIYYFVLGVAGQGTFDWSYAEGNEQVGPGSLGQYEYTFDGGVTWDTFGAVNPFHVQVNVETVPPPIPCEGDADHDGDRDFPDVISVLANFTNTYEPGELGAGDANGDGEVNFVDVISVLVFFDIPCP